MTFKNWIQLNYNTLNTLSKKIDEEDGEELLHFTLMKFFEKEDNTFLDNLEDHIKLKYISRTLKIQATSKESQFYRQFKRYTFLNKDVILELEEEDNELEEETKKQQINFIEMELKKMNWFSSLLFQRYIEIGCSAQKLSEQLLIPLTTVQYHIRKVKSQIKTNWIKNQKNGM
jgi:hypothetical protein